MASERIIGTQYLAWARSGARQWRPCTARGHAAIPSDIYEARYSAARWLAVDGVSEVLVLPDGVDPNRYRAVREGDRPAIPFVAWRAEVTRDTSPTTVRDLLHHPEYLTLTPTTR